LSLQFLHVIATQADALLRFTGSRIKFLLQACSGLPLAVDFQQRPGLGGLEPLLRQRAVGAQLVRFRGEVTSGCFERLLQLLLALLREPSRLQRCHTDEIGYQ
jgi:hypothetical protein